MQAKIGRVNKDYMPPVSDQQPPDPENGEDELSSKQDTESSSKEYGGPKGKEPTRYGDWEKNGRCIDF